MHAQTNTHATGYEFDMRINIRSQPKVYAGLCQILRKAGCVACTPFDGDPFTGLYTFKPKDDIFFSRENWDRVLGQMSKYGHFMVEKGVVSLSMSGNLTEGVNLVYDFLLWIEANLSPQLDECRDQLKFVIFNGGKYPHTCFQLAQRHRNGQAKIVRGG